MKKRFFIVAPSAASPEDTRYDLCYTLQRGTINDIYDQDKYQVITSRTSLTDIKAVAKRHKSKRPKVI